MINDPRKPYALDPETGDMDNDPEYRQEVYEYWQLMGEKPEDQTTEPEFIRKEYAQYLKDHPEPAEDKS